MAFSTRTVSILGSLMLSAVMVVSAFLLSGTGPAIVDAQSTEELLKAYAAQDTDGDDLPDWQEELYGSDPEDPYSLDPLMTDRQAVDSGKVKPRFESEELPPTIDWEDAGLPNTDAAPGTVTDRFARALFESFMRAKAEGAAPENLETFVVDALDEFDRADARPDTYSERDLVLAQGSGPAAIQAYGRATEVARVTPNVPAPQNELHYLQQYLLKKDEAALAHVRTLAAAYRKTAELYIRVPVPADAVGEHLRVANALAAMASIVEDLGAMDTDPLQGLFAIGIYDEAGAEFYNAMQDLKKVFAEAGVRFGVPYDFIDTP